MVASSQYFICHFAVIGYTPQQSFCDLPLTEATHRKSEK
ncbi:hypothetical protein COO91_05815 [Nostoc flagelliforme CCNUN1]|uniref:Uncharacterized protein n=1 Tax=Nostoc flagelliforme CCNUN1 TaxID=2038116 RepID=A0A2K8SWK3_9NOSO|nr:hypothetical protein COO91_05815 [Nostoc flagelliforme CCNUN1]